LQDFSIMILFFRRGVTCNASTDVTPLQRDVKLHETGREIVYIYSDNRCQYFSRIE
jgi:hypothetical protein